MILMPPTKRSRNYSLRLTITNNREFVGQKGGMKKTMSPLVHFLQCKFSFLYLHTVI